MEVIKSGITPSTWKKEVTCPWCNALLKISCNDIFIRTTRKDTLFSHKHILHYHIKCSECRTRIELKENNLPYVIKEYVYDNMDMADRLLNFYFS